VDFRDFSLMAEQWLEVIDDGRIYNRGVKP
jgi:hypothetical protein